MTNAPNLTVLIPAYNESAGLEHSVERVQRQLAALGVEAEILIVDDGSHDGTGALADRLAAAQPRVRALHHPANGGLGAAFQTGVANSRAEWLILIPADLPLELDDLHQYLEAAGGADIVVGNRSDLRDYTLYRRLVHYANIRLIRVLFGMPLRQFQYISLYRLATLRQMDIEFTGSAFFHAEVLIKARALGARLAQVEIRYHPRSSGQASGARGRLVIKSVRDLFRFWVRWVRAGPVAASRQRAGSPGVQGAG